MSQIVEFMTNHPELFLAFFGVAGALVWTTMQTRGGGRLTPNEVTRLMSDEDVVVLDVRGDADYRAGHIINSLHIPREQIEHQLNRLNRHRTSPVITVCRSGTESAGVAKMLRTNGFEKVFNLSGGLTAWESANLPLTKD